MWPDWLNGFLFVLFLFVLLYLVYPNVFKDMNEEDNEKKK
jgi:hypothetical protein